LVVNMSETENRATLRNETAPYEKDLATKTLQIQAKRFYLDVKENKRGKFIKVAEIAPDGRRDQIFLALSTAAEFRDHLSTFSDYYNSLGPPSASQSPTDDGKLKSEIMIKDQRRYYLDLKENARGRFLRVSQTGGGFRSHLAIPAQGMVEFRNTLSDIVEQFGCEDDYQLKVLPESQHMRAEKKSFHFDVGQNNRGIYMKVSEVQGMYRQSITVPERSWRRFRDIMDNFCKQMEELEAERKAVNGEEAKSDGE